MKKILGILIFTVLMISCDNQAGSTETKQAEHNIKVDPGTVNSLMDAAFPASPGLYGPSKVVSKRRYSYTFIVHPNDLADHPTGKYSIKIYHKVNGYWSQVYDSPVDDHKAAIIFPDVGETRLYSVLYIFSNQNSDLVYKDHKLVTVD